MANKSESSNFLKLKCKINDKLVYYLLDLRAMDSFMILLAMECWESILN